MSAIYIALIPLAAIVLEKKVALVLASYKSHNKSKLKADVFFLGLILLVIAGLVVAIERT